MKIIYVGYSSYISSDCNFRNSRAGYLLEYEITKRLSNLNSIYSYCEYIIKSKFKISSKIKTLTFVDRLLFAISVNIKLYLFLIKSIDKNEFTAILFYDNSYIFLLTNILKLTMGRQTNFFCVVADAPQYYINRTNKVSSSLIEFIEFWIFKNFDGYISMVENSVKDIVPNKPYHLFAFGVNRNHNYLKTKRMGTNGVYNVVYAGAIEPYYSTDILPLLAEKLPLNFIINVYGTGSVNKEMIIADKNIENFKFHGQIDRELLLEIYNSCDLLILFIRDKVLHRYNFPTKLIEYLATYRPILINSFDSLPKNLEHLLYFTDLNVKSISSKIQYILSINHDFADRKQKIDQLLDDHYNWDKEVSNIINFLVDFRYE